MVAALCAAQAAAGTAGPLGARAARAQPRPGQPDARQARDPAGPPPAPRYAAAVEAELRGLGADPLCRAESAALFRCEWSAAGPRTGASLELRAVVSETTDTVYLYAAEVGRAAPDAPGTAAVLRVLMELNHALLLVKLEWDAATGEIRASATLQTDSNLDRRALRTAVRAVTRVAERVRGDLARLAPGVAAPLPAPVPIRR
jgi:hypothetical protein